jgi:hypothetical protein
VTHPRFHDAAEPGRATRLRSIDPRELAELTGDHAAIGLVVNDNDDVPAPSWWTIGAAFVAFLASCLVWVL